MSLQEGLISVYHPFIIFFGNLGENERMDFMVSSINFEKSLWIFVKLFKKLYFCIGFIIDTI